jgi:hypothetical protein
MSIPTEHSLLPTVAAIITPNTNNVTKQRSNVWVPERLQTGYGVAVSTPLTMVISKLAHGHPSGHLLFIPALHSHDYSGVVGS